jgi:hypothetical protein
LIGDCVTPPDHPTRRKRTYTRRRRMRCTQTRNTQLTVRLEALGAQLDGAKTQLAGRSAQLLEAQAALVEKDGGLRRWEQQVRELEGQLAAAAERRRRLEEVVGQQEAGLGEAARKLADAEQRLVDKGRGFALLKADFVAQRVEIQEVTKANAAAAARIAALELALLEGRRLTDRAAGWRARSEATQMRVEDLEAALTRQSERRSDLVAAYWPVMLRLRAAERVVVALDRQLREAGLAPAAAMPAAPEGAAAAEEAAAAAAALAAAVGGEEQPGAGSPEDATVALGRHQGADECSSESDGNQPQQRDDDSQEAAGSEPRQEQQPSTSAPEAQQEPQHQQRPSEELLALKRDHDHLTTAWHLLQDEYWRQKDYIMALEIRAGQLEGSCRAAEANLAVALSEAGEARAAAAASDALRVRLEGDVVGLKAWLRTMEGTERRYLAAVR